MPSAFGFFCKGFSSEQRIHLRSPHLLKKALFRLFESALSFRFQLFFSALRTSGGGLRPASDLCAPGVPLFAAPPDRGVTGMRKIIRGKWQVFLYVPFPQNVRAVVFFAIAF